MQPILGNDPLDTAVANLPSALPQLLGDHFRGGVAVEETVSDHLPHHLCGSSVVRLRAALAALQGDRARLLECRAELKIARLAITELPRGLGRSTRLTLPLHEHQQLAGDLVVLRHAQDAARADQCLDLRIEFCHRCYLRKSVVCPALGLVCSWLPGSQNCRV